MKVIQLPFPGMELHQQCPICGRVAAILGQFSPIWAMGVCRDCAINNPVPADLWLDPASVQRRVSQTALRDGAMINPDPESSASREWRILAEGQIKDALRGCVLCKGVGWLEDSPACWRGEFVDGCRLCERRRRAGSRTTQYRRWVHAGMTTTTTWLAQGRFPICADCGGLHEATDINGAPAHLCQSCEDKRTLETLWRMRAIYAGDDAEGALDRMYRAFPGLFERGVLPDAWFRMMRGEK